MNKMVNLYHGDSFEVMKEINIYYWCNKAKGE